MPRRSPFRKEPPRDERTEAEKRISALIEREAEERAAELQRTLAIARAESASLLAQEERRLAEERRREFVDRERRLQSDLAMRLLEVQKRIEERLASWTGDVERMQQAIEEELGRLEQRQRQLVLDLERRLTEEAERFAVESEQQKALVTQLRAELEHAAKEAVAAATSELDAHAAERRRALHEVAERLRRRERLLSEQIEREQNEATRRIEELFADVERRQVEQLERTVKREAGRFAEAAAVQFDAAIKTAREDAARRLSRELDRAVGNFLREGEKLLAERLAELGGTGGRRLESQLQQVVSKLEQQRDEVLASVERRLAEAEAQFRERLDSVRLAARD